MADPTDLAALVDVDNALFDNNRSKAVSDRPAAPKAPST